MNATPKPSLYAAKRSRVQRTGLSDFHRAQKEESRQRIVDAALKVFSAKGYISATVEDIIAEAGVSRPTFYRYFESKFAVALAYYRINSEGGVAMWTRIAGEDFREERIVRRWLSDLIDLYTENREGLRTYMEMGAIEHEFLRETARYLPEIMQDLAARIPAFHKALAPGKASREIWVEAYFLLHQILTEATNNAMFDWGVSKTEIVTYLAGNFSRFVERYDAR